MRPTRCGGRGGLTTDGRGNAAKVWVRQKRRAVERRAYADNSADPACGGCVSVEGSNVKETQQSPSCGSALRPGKKLKVSGYRHADKGQAGARGE